MNVKESMEGSDNLNETKQLKRFYLNENWIQYIEEVRVQEGFETSNNALTHILSEHKKLSNNLFNLQFIVSELKREFSSEIQNSIQNGVSEEMKRIRLGTNNTDRNTQILIELLQGFMFINNIKSITTTNDYKPDFLTQTEKVVHERITHLKQKKHSNQINNGGNSK